MAFSTRFLANFTPEEQESEIIKIYAVQGDNADLALHQEATKRIQQATELIAFPEARLRSWLSFLLKDVPNVTSANGNATVTVEPETANDVILPKGALISSASGKIYTQISNDIQVPPGQSVQISVRQGVAAEHTGNYTEYIAIPGDDLDISNIEVYLNELPIPRCRIIEGYVTPTDGFHCFYYNNTLFIKIYPGDSTPYPEGQPYTVVTWQSEGKYGNISAGDLDGYVDEVLDINGLPATLSFQNEPIVNGANTPTRADLVQQLREWFFVKTSVSSVPEYRIWYLNQLEVGAIIVEGDYERYLRSALGEVQITGRVYVAGLDREGKPLSPSARLALDTRIASVKDIAIINWEEPKEVLCFVDVRYQASANNTEFVNLVKSTVENYFNLSWLREQDMSLFDDLDFEDVRETIGTDYNQAGLIIEPYHVYVDTDVTGSNWTNPDTSIYKGESLEGFYQVYAPLPEEEGGGFAEEPYAIFKQFPQPDGTAEIYCTKDETGQYSDLPVLVGNRRNGVTEISNFQFTDHSKIEAYWGIAEPGLLPIGTTYGYRSLYRMAISQYSGD